MSTFMKMFFFAGCFQMLTFVRKMKVMVEPDFFYHKSTEDEIKKGCNSVLKSFIFGFILLNFRYYLKLQP